MAHYKELLFGVGGIVVDTRIAEQEKGSTQCIAPGMGQFGGSSVASSVQGAVLHTGCQGSFEKQMPGPHPNIL